MTLNISFFSIEFPPRIFGGLGSYVTNISREFIKLNNKVIVFTPNEDYKLKPKEKWNGIKVYRPQAISEKDALDIFLSNETKSQWGDGIDFLLNLLSYNQLSASILINKLMKQKGKSIDLCVGHDWLGLPALMTVKRETNIPTIYHVHSTESGRSLGNINPQVQALELKGAKIADKVITVSYAMRDELILLGFPEYKIEVCYNGVDAINCFNPSLIDNLKSKKIKKQYNIKEEDKVILFIGRLSSVKGADKLVQAMPLILKENPTAKLILVGTGSKEHEIRSLIEKNGLQNCTFLTTEFLDDKTKIHYYSIADVCVFPSLYEPFGIVALEAMAMEKPVVVGARGTSGLREIVVTPNNKNPTGMHINPYSASDIAWGVNVVLKDMDSAIELGKNGRKRVLENFTWEKIAKQTLIRYKG